MGKLDNKVAIITGAGQGIGRGIALAMVKEGATAVLAEINEDTCIRTANEIKALGGRALPVTCDTRRRDEVRAVVAAAAKEFGTVNILVTCAQSKRDDVPFEDTTDDDMALALESGLLGTFYFHAGVLSVLEGARRQDHQLRLIRRYGGARRLDSIRCLQGGNSGADARGSSRVGKAQHQCKRHLPAG